MGPVWPVESNKGAESVTFDGETQIRRACGVCVSPCTTDVILWSGNEVTGRVMVDPREEDGSSDQGFNYSHSHSLLFHFWVFNG